MLITGQIKQWRREKSSKMALIKENMNNVDDKKSDDRRFETSVNREMHAISCANKTARNGSLSHLFLAFHNGCFSAFDKRKQCARFRPIFHNRERCFSVFSEVRFFAHEPTLFFMRGWSFRGRKWLCDCFDFLRFGCFLIAFLPATV